MFALFTGTNRTSMWWWGDEMSAIRLDGQTIKYQEQRDVTVHSNFLLTHLNVIEWKLLLCRPQMKEQRASVNY